MGKNYYLCHGYNVNDFTNLRLEKIKLDKLGIDLDNIDSYTSTFKNYESFKQYLLKKGLINDLEEDIVIGSYKLDKFTNKRKLIPIYLKSLVFEEDLKVLGIPYYDPYAIAGCLWNYIKARYNDRQFLEFIVKDYEEKYSQSKKFIPIYEDGSIGVIINCLQSKEYARNNKVEFEECFRNFFMNELYHCTTRKNERGKLFIPNRDLINAKGLHDMLVRIINYIKCYEPDKYFSEVGNDYRYQQDGEHEEFLEPSDFDRTIKDYAEQVGLDLTDEAALKSDSYVKSLVMEKETLFPSREEID